MNNQLQKKDSMKVPEPTLRRLPWYLSNVKLLRKRGERFVSSTQISKEINIDASQIAKDLSYVNISGRTRVGYDIDTYCCAGGLFGIYQYTQGFSFRCRKFGRCAAARFRFEPFRLGDCGGIRC